LSVAIGSHALTPMEIATGYTVFANGGYKIDPYFIERIENFNDDLVFQSNHPVVCDPCNIEPTLIEETDPVLTQNSPSPLEQEGLASINSELERPAVNIAPRVIDERVAYIMNSILRSVITEGS